MQPLALPQGPVETMRSQLRWRSLLAGCLTIITPGVLAPVGAQHHAAAHQTAASSAVPAARRFPVSRTVRQTLTAQAVRLMVNGRMTEMLGYNGQVPGPTLELREGDSVIVRFTNALDEPTSIHWHGLHLPFLADGSPFHPVPPGGEYVYTFVVPPGSAGTYWYHPHPHHRTGTQIARGLYGALIVRSADDPLRDFPEQLLVLSDNRFRPDGAVDLAEPNTPQAAIDFENGREGDVIFVNGEVTPTLTIRPGEIQRWRIINASAARVYRLALGGHDLLHVGTDGGLFETPVSVRELLLANGERVEVLVRGTAGANARASLQALPYDRYVPQTRPLRWNETRDVLTLAYTSEAPIMPKTVPARLRAVPALDTADATATRTIVLSQGMINGQLMDMDRVDISAPLDATEIWEIENIVGMDHPFHLHGFQFQVLSRNGVPESFRSWKDVVNVPKHGSVRFIVRYTDYPGKWMFHCHILDHEDHGMMGILEVR